MNSIKFINLTKGRFKNLNSINLTFNKKLIGIHYNLYITRTITILKLNKPQSISDAVIITFAYVYKLLNSYEFLKLQLLNFSFFLLF